MDPWSVAGSAVVRSNPYNVANSVLRLGNGLCKLAVFSAESQCKSIMSRLSILLIVFLACPIGLRRGSAGGLDEFKIKRQEIFEFSAKPRVTRQGDQITVTFTAKAFCDATVAIETADARIVRHLAS